VLYVGGRIRSKYRTNIMRESDREKRVEVYLESDVGCVEKWRIPK
jgi:hypothetical protein